MPNNRSSPDRIKPMIVGDVSIVDALIYVVFAFIIIQMMRFFFVARVFFFNGAAAVNAIDFFALRRLTCFVEYGHFLCHYRNQLILHRSKIGRFFFPFHLLLL